MARKLPQQKRAEKSVKTVRKEVKRNIKRDKPLNKPQQRVRASDINAASGKRIAKREAKKENTQAAGRRKRVTMDARKEVNRSRTSGVQVNNKQVSRGKVNAAEQAVRNAKNVRFGKNMEKVGEAGVRGNLAALAATELVAAGKYSSKKSREKSKALGQTQRGRNAKNLKGSPKKKGYSVKKVVKRKSK